MDHSSERACTDQSAMRKGEGGGVGDGRLPDFVPGWYRGRPAGVVHEQMREAVRVIGVDSFPLCFLRPDEAVRISSPPMQGVCIQTLATPDFTLAVPPGYWIVRGRSGVLHNWRDEDFRKRFTRLPGAWAAPAERVADREAIDELIEEGPPWWWQGKPPAEGTRRRLILDAIARGGPAVTLTNGDGGMLSEQSQLGLVDRVESALLDSQIAIEALDVAGPLTDNPHLPPEFKIRVDDVDDDPPPHLRHSERELWRKSRFDEYRFLLMRLSRERAGRLEDRLAAQEAPETTATFVAGERSSNCPYGSSEPAAGSCGIGDCPFHHPHVWPEGSPERRACEAGIPVRPYDHEADKLAEKRAADAGEEVGEGSVADLVEESYAARLLRQREEARGGEDSFKHQRDAALNCLRWLIGDLIPNGGQD